MRRTPKARRILPATVLMAATIATVTVHTAAHERPKAARNMGGGVWGGGSPIRLIGGGGLWADR